MKSKFWILLLISVLTSCASKKDLLYVQDAVENSTADINYQTITIQPNDILKIDVETLIPEAARAYNQGSVGQNGLIPNLLILQLEGYLVTNEGTINFPSLGEISVINLTIHEVREKIKEELVKGGHLKNPRVFVRIVNPSSCIFTEVRPR